jgi:hypothetical protein
MHAKWQPSSKQQCGGAVCDKVRQQRRAKASKELTGCRSISPLKSWWSSHAIHTTSSRARHASHPASPPLDRYPSLCKAPHLQEALHHDLPSQCARDGAVLPAGQQRQRKDDAGAMCAQRGRQQLVGILDVNSLPAASTQ